jgi:hypothetical protein
VEVDSIPQQTPEKTAQIVSADIVVGVLAEFNQNEINLLCEGLRTLPGSPRIVVLHRDPAGNAATVNSRTAPEDAHAEYIHCVSIAFRADRKTGSSRVLLCDIKDGKRHTAMGLPIGESSPRIGI